jgi:hypothetical protein
MRTLAAGFFALAVTVTAAAQKPAWQWTLDERIAKRLDPDDIRARTIASEREMNRRELESMGIVAPPLRFVIDGKRNAELFLPFELFGSILTGVDEDLAGRRMMRTIYGAAIRESGWTEELFWQTLEEASADYFEVQRERLALESSTFSLTPVERRAVSAKAEALNVPGCRLRADALQRVRTKLGTEKFDRFLYERVAPNVGVGSDFPLANEEWRLRYLESGCR